MRSSSARANGSSCAAMTQASGAGGSAEMSSATRTSSYWSLSLMSSGRIGHRISSLQLLAELLQAAGDAARDRARGEVERVPDLPVALVLREEAVEDLAA